MIEGKEYMWREHKELLEVVTELDCNTKILEDKVDKTMLREVHSNDNTLLVKQESSMRILAQNNQQETEKKTSNEKYNLLVKKLSKIIEDANHLKQNNQ